MSEIPLWLCLEDSSFQEFFLLENEVFNKTKGQQRK
jgi:hypothetical protein